MPPRKDPNTVKQLFIAAGFIPTDAFNYQNIKQKHRVYDILNGRYINMSLQTLNYNVKAGRRPLWDEPTIITSTEPHEPLHSLDRFIRSHPGDFERLPFDHQRETHEIYRFLRAKIMTVKPFVYQFKQDETSQIIHMRATIMALRDSLPKILPKHSIKLKVTTITGAERYFHVNSTTLDDLWAIFKDVDPDFSVEDSAGNFAINSLNIDTIDYTFKPQKHGKQVIAGFFPFINTTSTDLSAYGIYNNIDDPRVIEPCLLTAFRRSGIMMDDEMNQLTEMINTRDFPQVYIKNIAEHFKINVYVKHYHDDLDQTSRPGEKSRSSHVEYNDPSYDRSIRLMILYNHYALYNKVEGTNKFIYSVIKDMIKAGQLRPFSQREFEKVYGRIINSTPARGPYNSSRPIIIRPPKPSKNPYSAQCKYSEHLFGYKPDENEVNARLDELQEFVDSLHTRRPIDVRTYFKFSRLMERIMFEYGCFDDVYELAGTSRDSIRGSLVFPGREIIMKNINEKCYYIDFNGAFCSFMTHIPTGRPTPNFTGINTKIGELINKMYNARVNAKKMGNDKLARTIKFIMCSCYGKSIAKPVKIKRKWSENIEGTLNNLGVLVSSYDNKPAGFVNVIQPYVEHYSYPQFARVILDGFDNKVRELEGIVNILFRNIDAFVVNESDFNKLKQLGYIHPTELGKLKVEHVFTSMTFFSKMRWVGVNEDGTEFRHCC